jgi:ribosomal protein S18 acetylase RimI-like enzyme
LRPVQAAQKGGVGRHPEIQGKPPFQTPDVTRAKGVLLAQVAGWGRGGHGMVNEARRSMSPPSVSVRLSTVADADAIRDAIVQVQDFERALHDTRRPGPEIADAYFDYLRRQAEQQHGAIFVAEVGGSFVGYVACWITADDAIAETSDSNVCGYISDIGVLPDYRGQGIAADLLNAAQEHVASFGVRRLRIISLAANASAQRAYLKYGFEPYEIILRSASNSTVCALQSLSECSLLVRQATLPPVEGPVPCAASSATTSPPCSTAPGRNLSNRSRGIWSVGEAFSLAFDDPVASISETRSVKVTPRFRADYPPGCPRCDLSPQARLMSARSAGWASGTRTIS